VLLVNAPINNEIAALSIFIPNQDYFLTFMARSLIRRYGSAMRALKSDLDYLGAAVEVMPCSSTTPG
jgi:hypothetical protein